MEDEKCMHSMSWEEEIYWNHFQFIHFSQTLHSGFDRQLAIPQHFSKNLKKKLPETVTLKGPSGTWEVRLKTENDVMFFEHGWNEFVKDHVLQEKDLLVFKYNGNSQFDVLIFDGETLCEKASSYFVKKGARMESSSGCLEKRKIGENSGEGSLLDVNPSPSVEKSGDNNFADTPLAQRSVRSKASKKRSREPSKLIEPSWEWHVLGSEQNSAFGEELETKPDLVQKSLSSSLVYDVPFISSRRFVTEEEKQNALQLALAASTDSGFIQVMKPTSVLRKFFMAIPSGWIARHLEALLAEDVILRTKEYTWRVKFLYQKSRNSGGLSSGWRNFVMDNNLQEFDVAQPARDQYFHVAVLTSKKSTGTRREILLTKNNS